MDKEAIKFTEDEIKSAKVVRDTVSQSPDELKSIYMAGEIVMWDELQKHSTELRKENEELNKAFETNKEQFIELAIHATDLEATIIEKDKEIAELKKQVNDLTQSDMTHEYNNAEAARVWSQIEQQIREDEREKLQTEIAELKNDMQTMEEQDKLRCETYEKLIGQMEEQQRTIDELKDGLKNILEKNMDYDSWNGEYPNETGEIAQSLLSKHNSNP